MPSNPVTPPAEATAPASGAPRERVVVDADGVSLHTWTWDADAPRAVVHIVHGVGEHARRYDHVAVRLVASGFTVVADDHRAHGATGAGHEGVGNLGRGTVRAALEGVGRVDRAIKADLPDTPLVLLGHSWGSFIAQTLVARSSAHYDGLVLSGSSLALPGLTRRAAYNAAWDGPEASGREWLSRDPEVGRAFADDPWCFDVGDEPPFSLRESLAISGAPPRRLDHDLPVLVHGGSEDPIGGERGQRLLAAAYERWTRLSDVTCLVYPGARHEIYNETNREQVLDDLVAWLDVRF
ncbi:hypothetical protein GCM10025865_28240 [Paraoerskovia sediminicola]|uniref:Serine aminopeptidase S33 domain-containing protein n=1 Tax=Paraoerskovia sediminicola TaxID=1138587 RepID=A0ABN6XFM0_9CELL|nr:alpha/beta hydrolase [Paraoerskovia sediminicola]BDZ43525.1 hypothetical protein GCM10025865_28240 [Paraoerskovia sediminicola]